MGRRGGLRAAANREEHLSRTRESLYALAPRAVEWLEKMLGDEKPDLARLQVVASVLDRTIGKTTQVEIDTSPSGLFRETIAELADDP